MSSGAINRVAGRVIRIQNGDFLYLRPAKTETGAIMRDVFWFARPVVTDEDITLDPGDGEASEKKWKIYKIRTTNWSRCSDTVPSGPFNIQHLT